MKWVERKLDKVARRWGVREAMSAKPNKTQLKELKEDCIVESTLKIWFEIGGKGNQKEEKEETVEVEFSGRGERRVDPDRETEDETSLRQTDTNETGKLQTEKSTQDSAGDTETDDSERTRLLVATDTE